MRYDQQAIREAERNTFAQITAPTSTVIDDKGVACVKENKFYVDPLNVSMPAELVQEQPWVNSTQNYTFDFSVNAPVQVAGTNNNVILGQSGIFCPYAIKILFRDGANSANGVYRTSGVTPNDDALYNSIISMKMLQSTLVDKVNGQNFRDVETGVNEFYNTAGMLLINPVRVIPGNIGIWQVNINLLNPVAALTISPNQYISVRLVGAYGQASA